LNRWLAVGLAIIGGAIAALAAIIAVGGGLVGFLWLFVFGDNPWPLWAETVLNLAIPIAGLALWAMIGLLIWSRLTGPRQAG
jgi:hypothetical protein